MENGSYYMIEFKSPRHCKKWNNMLWFGPATVKDDFFSRLSTPRTLKGCVLSRETYIDSALWNRLCGNPMVFSWFSIKSRVRGFSQPREHLIPTYREHQIWRFVQRICNKGIHHVLIVSTAIRCEHADNIAREQSEGLIDCHLFDADISECLKCWNVILWCFAVKGSTWKLGHTSFQYAFFDNSSTQNVSPSAFKPTHRGTNENRGLFF